MDFTSIIGLFLGGGLIFLGFSMEGGGVADLSQVTAFIIVGGGTLGSIVLCFPSADLLGAFKHLKVVFGPDQSNYGSLIAEIIDYAGKARKEGVIVLEKEAKKASDPLMKMGLEAVSDGADPTLVRELMENQLGQLEDEVDRAAKVWESAGAISPTIGIMGAVLGLIEVMKNLSDPAALGAGIAVAFVATIYGLAIANLVCIPLGTKMKFKSKQGFLAKEITIEGILSIQAGESPTLIERKLQSFLIESPVAGDSGDAQQAKA